MNEPTEQEVERLIARLESGGRDVNMRSVQIDAADMIESLSSRLAAERKDAERRLTLLREVKYELGDWGDSDEDHTHYCPNCDNSIDGNRTIRNAIDAAIAESTK